MKNGCEIDFVHAAPDAATVQEGIDRRAFLMRSAAAGAVAVITCCSAKPPDAPPVSAAPAPAPAAPPLAEDLHVVKKARGPVMTTLDEFYKVGPGPSSSHTIGPMRITYDFYRRCTKLRADQLAKATRGTSSIRTR
jgi:L-serine dehydratase